MDSLSQGFCIQFGEDNEYAFLFYDGSSWTNVSNAVTISGDSVTEGQVTTTYFTYKHTTNSEYNINVIKMTPSTLGGNATITYNTYKIEHINVTYPEFFASSVQDSSNDFNSNIKTSYSLNVGDEVTAYFYSYKFDEVQQKNILTDVSGNITVADGNIVSYVSSGHKIKAEKTGDSFQIQLDNDGPGVWFNVERAQTSVNVEGTDSTIDLESLDAEFEFTYNSTNYVLGLGNSSESGSTLHIDSGSQVDLSQNDGQTTSGFGESVLIGKVDVEGNITEPAQSEIYNLFTNFTFKVIAENKIKDKITASYGKDTVLGVETDTINVSVAKDALDIKEKANAIIEVGFKYDNKSYTIQFGIDIEKPDRVSINSSLSELSTILASEDSLETKSGKELDEDTIVEINLDPSVSYTETLTINCGNNFHDLIINGNGATIYGGIITKNSLTQINEVNFVANGTEKGIYLQGDSEKCSGSEDSTIGDLYQVQNCTFNGYTYGIYSDGYGLVSGIQDCTFTSCDTGIYINSDTNCYYSDSLNDTFIDCKTGIEIVKLSSGCTPYQFVMRDMVFVNNENTSITSDYTVHCSGNFFYFGNYYGTYTGTCPDNILTGTTVRSAKISYVDTNTANTKIYTNPCIRYPGSDNANLGIDNTTGLFTAVLSGDEEYSQINLADLNNINSDISLDICQKGTGNQLATLTFEKVVD